MDIENTELSRNEWDELNDPRPEETEFDVIVGTALSRRGHTARAEESCRKWRTNPIHGRCL